MLKNVLLLDNTTPTIKNSMHLLHALGYSRNQQNKIHIIQYGQLSVQTEQGTDLEEHMVS